MTLQTWKTPGSAFQTGTILIWTGSIASIPDGWVLCDGNNGTPNLLGKFAKGIPTSGTAPGSTGGSANVTLTQSQLPSHSHTGSSDTVGDHTHEYTTDDWHVTNGSTDGKMARGSPDTDLAFNAAGAHSHGVSLGNTGGSSSITNLPPYYEAAYIMKT